MRKTLSGIEKIHRYSSPQDCCPIRDEKKTLNGRKLNLNIADDDCDYYNSDSIKAVNKLRCIIPKVGNRSKYPKIFLLLINFWI